MVHVWVGQKTCKHNILRDFTMSLFENIQGDYWLMTCTRKRLIKQANAILIPVFYKTGYVLPISLIYHTPFVNWGHPFTLQPFLTS